MSRTPGSRAVAAAAAAALSVVCLTTLAACSGEGPGDASQRAAAPETPQSAPEVPARVRVVDPPGVHLVRYYVLNESCPYCRDLRRTIEGAPAKASAAPTDDPPLAQLYGDRVRFEFRPAFPDSTLPNPEMAPLGFAESAHGFAGITPDGLLAFSLPGHHHTRADLVEAIDAMLGTAARR